MTRIMELELRREALLQRGLQRTAAFRTITTQLAQIKRNARSRRNPELKNNGDQK